MIRQSQFHNLNNSFLPVLKHFIFVVLNNSQFLSRSLSCPWNSPNVRNPCCPGLRTRYRVSSRVVVPSRLMLSLPVPCSPFPSREVPFRPV